MRSGAWHSIRPISRYQSRASVNSAKQGVIFRYANRRTRSQLSAFSLVFGGRSIYGTLTGTAIDSEDALAFSVLENVRPMIETVPLERAADAYARMMQGKARCRMVLTMKACQPTIEN